MSPGLLVVGAGPCGASAALWARSLGLGVEVLEREEAPGGQLRSVHFPPLNFAGAAEGDGRALAARLARQLGAAGIAVRRAEAAALEPEAAAVRTAAGERIEAAAVLIATGVRRRLLDVPGERELEGRGVSYSATRDRARLAGRPVIVVGGGDAAFENALILAEAGSQVTLVARRAARARREFRDRVAAEPRIELLENTSVAAIEGEGAVAGVRLAGPGGRVTREASGVVVKIGVVPNTEWCRGAVELDPEGYALVDANFLTSHPRAWAAGDVTRPPLFGIAVAVGQGALAVAAVRRTVSPPPVGAAGRRE